MSGFARGFGMTMAAAVFTAGCAAGSVSIITGASAGDAEATCCGFGRGTAILGAAGAVVAAAVVAVAAGAFIVKSGASGILRNAAKDAS
jgi:hypothetical protein